MEVQIFSGAFQLTNWIMSLLSQQDRLTTIAALENYIMMLRASSLQDTTRIAEANTLLNWVKLEYQKNSGE